MCIESVPPRDAAPPSELAHIVQLATAVVPPADGIISLTVFQNDGLKAVLFGFGAGQELSEHTASRPAVMHFLSGEAAVTLGNESLVATPGTWVHIPADLPHSILARIPSTMLLLLLK
jgi:quercetin dioxygenase-like cupin family protein